MKLSMWMIANRLSAMDPVVELEENAPVTLNSARLAYATNCLHVYAEDDDVVCKGDGGTLRFQGMDLRTGFEVMQSVFDYFEDWKTGLQENIQKQNFEEAVNLAWQVLRNPMVLFDANNRVLGLTRQYDENSLDVEWRYLCKYGYSSLDAVRQLRYNRREEGIKNGVSYGSKDNNLVGYGGITYALNWSDVVCGRITLLSRERALNTGDYQILEMLVDMLQPVLGQMFFYNERNSTADVFLNLLLGKPYGEEQLAARLRYTSWKADDSFYLTVVGVKDDGNVMEHSVRQMQQVLSNYVLNSVVLKNGNDLAILTNRDLKSDAASMEMLQNLMENNPISLGFSLEGRGIGSISSLYQQGRYAISRGTELHPEERIYQFFLVALDYMLEYPLNEAAAAIMPSIVELWESSRSGDDLSNTLRIYLDNDCSAVKTAVDLYIHRNTVLYRVQKAEEQLGLNFHRVYDRNYYLFSVRVLELNEKVNGAPKSVPAPRRKKRGS